MLPPFNNTGDLPPGIHVATWSERVLGAEGDAAGGLDAGVFGDVANEARWNQTQNSGD
jgi:hypothetical protein